MSNQQQIGASQGQVASNSTSSAAGQANTTPAPAPEDPVFGPLDAASKVLDERLARDERWQGFGDALGGGAASADYVMPPNPAWAPFQKTRTVQLPDELFDAHDLRSARCSMGLLPEIDRSWVTVDHRLLLWDWADGSSFSTFEELTDVIVGVALVKPRPGVFVDSISHLLVLATPNQISLVGLGYAPSSPGAKKEVTFYLTGLSVPTDGVSLTCIKGTSTGRIFLSSSPDPLQPGGIGGDGCLYELVYQSAEGWFVKRCTLYNLTSSSITKSVVPTFLRAFTAVPQAEWVLDIVVDDERGLIYTLLRNGSIEMYQLPSTAPNLLFDGPANKVAKASDILRQAQTICPQSPMLQGRAFKIVSLETVSKKEGGTPRIGLVAVTSTGVRLYFSHQRRGYSYGYASTAQPAALELCHVRPPPAPAGPLPIQPLHPFSSQATPHSQQQQQQPQTPQIPFNSIILAKYAASGLLLAANNVDPDSDVLFVAAPDVASAARAIAESISGTSSVSAAQTRPFSEVAGSIEVAGRTWDMAEITLSSPGIAPEPGSGTALNELATQSTLARREWVVLTNMGATVVARQRPVDTLLDVLESASISGNGASGEVGVFFESYGRDQACAMLLSIAAGNSRLARTEASSAYATRYGANGRSGSSAVVEQARSLFFEGGGRPVSVDRGGYGGAAGNKIIFSGRHEGLAFYFARLVRPIWKRRVTFSTQMGQMSSIPESTLSTVQQDLLSLRTFIEQEQQLFTLLPDSGRSSQPAEAYQAERASLTGLQRLLTQTVEAISFVLLLIDYKLPEIVASCSSEVQNALLALSYQDLLTTKGGREIARALVSAVINQQIGRQLSVDAISDTLQQRCGSFCSADDVILYKAIEAIRRAKDTPDSQERIESLRESLRLFVKATKHLSFDRAKEICSEYNAMRYPLGAIDLALNCAQEWDASQQAVSYWSDGQPPNDARLPAYELRKKCNDLVFDTLSMTDDLLNQASQPNRSGAALASLSLEEADSLRSNAYSKVLSVKDEFFHFSLYDWFLSRGRTDQLLETRALYLENYLSQDPTTLEKSDLLWQFYVRTSRFAQAAAVLAALADTPVFALSLNKRVEYLALAVGNAKSQFPSGKTDIVQLLTEVEEKLDVAQVQIEIYRAVEELALPSDEKSQWLERVEDRLYTISELYTEFAAPLELLEIELLIFHVSDHRDLDLVRDTWERIIKRVHDEAPERRLEALSAKITDLGRRFHDSDVAFPLPLIASMLEQYSYQNRNDMRAGWVPMAFRESGFAWDAIFVALDEVFVGRLPPFESPAGLLFLAGDITDLIEAWVHDASSTHASSPYSITPAFPATEVDTALDNYVKTLKNSPAAADVVRRLNEAQRKINRRY